MDAKVGLQASNRPMAWTLTGAEAVMLIFVLSVSNSVSLSNRKLIANLVELKNRYETKSIKS